MRTIRNCSVAVVGGAGFLGSHLVNYLTEERHCRVLVLDNLITGKREFVHPDAKFEYADITASEATLYRLFKLYKIHHVFNYAAEPYIPVSFERPLHVFNINAMGALQVINAAQDAKVESILQVSSAEIYGDAGEGKPWRMRGFGAVPDPEPPIEMRISKSINEDGEVRPHSSYGAAKAAIDALVQVRWREAKTPCIALRQFNCLGERETHPYIVPEIISQLARQHPDYSKCNHDDPDNSGMCIKCQVVLDEPDGNVRLGNNSFRDFLYAGDAVRMAVELLEGGRFGEVYNLGSETGIKMYDLAQLIGKLMGFTSVEVVPDPERVRPWEIWHLQADNSKINAVVKSRPQVTMEEGLRRAIEWYRDNGNRWAWET